MAREHESPAFKVSEELRLSLESLHRRLNMIENATTHTLQVIDVTVIDDPIEGEEVIDPTDNKHKVYCNGQWRFCEEIV